MFYTDEEISVITGFLNGYLVRDCASANTRLQIVFFFMVCYAPSLKYSGRVSTLSVSYQRKSLTSPAKVRGKCHKTVTKSVCRHFSRRP